MSSSSHSATTDGRTRSGSGWRWRSAALPIGAGAAFTLLYLATLTDVHTFDALSYILDVDRKPWRELFHPHHLAYGPFGAAVRMLATGLGWSGSAERWLQAANALAGGVGVGLFAALLARIGGHWRPAALGALLLGASYAYWYYAGEVEVYTIAAVFLIGALGLLLALIRCPTPRLALSLGLIQGLAVLFHQTNVLLTAPALAALTLGLRRAHSPAASRRALKVLLAYAAPLALIVGGAYLGVGLGVSGLRSWEAFYRWVANYVTIGYWGGAVDGAKLVQLGQGLARSVAQPGGAAIGLVMLCALVMNVRRLGAAQRGTLVVTLTWLAVYGAFFLWWEPDNIEFWIASLPPFYLMVALATGGSASSRIPWSLAVLTCGLLMLGINGVAITRRGDAARDLHRVTTAALVQQSRPGDLFIVPDGVLELYLPFYGNRANVISLNQAMTATGDWGEACAWIHTRIETALSSGYAVLIAAEAIRPPPSPPGEPPAPVERLGLSEAMVAACYAPLQPILIPLMPGYYRIPAAQELADGPGWDFTRGRWGWRMLNATPATGPYPGLALRPGVDPALISPPIRLDLMRYRAVEVRLAAATADRQAQLFLLDAEGRADEARSLRWTLVPDSTMQTYHLDLLDLPDREKVVAGLRFDPVGVGDGGIVVVEAIRLVP